MQIFKKLKNINQLIRYLNDYTLKLIAYSLRQNNFKN